MQKADDVERAVPKRLAVNPTNHLRLQHLPRIAGLSIKVLIRRVEFGGAKNDHFHRTDGAMADTWGNQDGGAWPDRMGLAVQFDHSIVGTLHHHIDLGLVEVVMGVRILGDFRPMDRGGKVRSVFEGAASGPAGAGDAWQRRKIDQLECGRFDHQRVGCGEGVTVRQSVQPRFYTDRRQLARFASCWGVGLAPQNGRGPPIPGILPNR